MVGAGTAKISATLAHLVQNPTGGCIRRGETRECSVTSKPRLDLITPARGPIGASTMVTIRGSGFKDPVTIDAGTGITATANSVNDAQIVATFDISATAPAGDHVVTVTVNNMVSSSVNFFVQVPTSLSLTIGGKVTYNGNDMIECDGTNNGPRWGYSHCLTYRLLDQNGASLQGGSFTVEETVVTVASNPPNIPGRNANNPLASDGTFQDFLAFVAVAPPPPQPGEFVKQRQTFVIRNNNTGTGHQVRVNCLNFQSNDLTVTNITGGGTCQ